MEASYTFKRNLWYRLATVYGGMYECEYDTYSKPNLCEYMQHVAWGFAKIALYLFGSGMIGVVFQVVGLIFLQTYLPNMHDHGFVLFALVLYGLPVISFLLLFGIAILSASGIIGGMEALNRRKRKKWLEAREMEPSPPSFLGAAYSAWKDKVCVTIDFED